MNARINEYKRVLAKAKHARRQILVLMNDKPVHVNNRRMKKWGRVAARWELKALRLDEDYKTFLAEAASTVNPPWFK